MDRAIAELGRPQPLADVVAVVPVDRKVLLDELGHGVDLFGRVRDHPPAAKVGHVGQRVLVEGPLADDLLGEAGNRLRPGLDDRQRGQLLGGIAQHLGQHVGIQLVVAVNLCVALNVPLDPVVHNAFPMNKIPPLVEGKGEGFFDKTPLSLWERAG